MAAERVVATGGQQPANPSASPAEPVAGVRTDDAVLAGLIRDATERSPTFRRLVEAIRATDGIVLIERGRCGHYVRSCLAYWMVMAGPHRILRVVVDARKAGDEAAASIGHELQHAVEVLANPNVRTGVEMHAFFERIGVRRVRGFETRAAVDADRAVDSELRARKSSSTR
jgi:hypothetical protein